MIDCDIHPVLPGTNVLVPFLDEHWQDQVIARGIDGLDIAPYHPQSPLSGRADWRPGPQKKAGTTVEEMRRQALDPFGLDLAICNVIYGGQAVFNVDLAAALCAATNDWLAQEWLDKEPRLRGSIVVPVQDPGLAAEEIERRAIDPRFVQVLMLSTADMPLGHRYYWPIYRAAAAAGLPVGIHAGAVARHAPTYIGWPSYGIEDYAAQSQTFQGQLLSLIYEGVFQKFPDLTVVFIESGVTWLPSCLSRADNTWRGLRTEVPWVDQAPSEIARRHIRLTTQPFDAPRDAATVDAIINQIGSDDMLLFATDYPHWQFEDDNVLPAGLSASLRHRLGVENPRATYKRLLESVA